MKDKFLIILLIGFLLSIPLSANAGLFGAGKLDSAWSNPDSNGYYADSDGKVLEFTSGYTTDDFGEIFCFPENNTKAAENVAFCKTTPNLDMLIGSKELYEKMAQAVFIADSRTAHIKNEMDEEDIYALEGEEQKTIWGVVGVFDSDILEKEGNYYKESMTPIPSLTETSTMLLIGIGLISLAGIGRKRFIKK